jgi:hypothetical protein
MKLINEFLDNKQKQKQITVHESLSKRI